LLYPNALIGGGFQKEEEEKKKKKGRPAKGFRKRKMLKNSAWGKKPLESKTTSHRSWRFAEWRKSPQPREKPNY